MKSFLYYFILLHTLIYTGVKANAQSKKFGNLTYGEASNISERQRMLSQMMSKAFMIRVLGNDNTITKKEVDSSRQLFDTQLKILIDNASDKYTLKALNDVSHSWKKFKKHITGEPNKQNGAFVMKENTALLNACNNVIKAIEHYYLETVHPTKDVEDLFDIIVMSGRQRMLAQRLCLYYSSTTVYTEENNNYKEHLKDIFYEFETGITLILACKFNNDEVRAQLPKLLYFWHNFKKNEILLYKAEFDIGDMYEYTNKLTTTFELITTAYQKIYDQ